MSTENKQDIQALIDQVKAASGTDVMLIVNTEEQAKIFKELLPGIDVICTYGNLESDDKCYIMPCGKPVKIIYE